ncbi:CRISPR-associated protein Csx11 [Thermodesulfobium sp. 4217-1]|uniref:CRISPR-associated protein Csx11 n=1 Tax=Thermodesulfobium sp. 4217-1 TaxID=3120013 RepID=UPI0032219571
MLELNLENLKKYRDDILKAEIGTLLFNLGKTHVGFSPWRPFFSNSNYKWSSYKDYVDNFLDGELKNTDIQLKDFIDATQIDLNFISSLKLKFKEIMKGDKSSSDFIKKIFFRGCENINSGIDKGSPKEQLKGNLWISNAFGSFKKNVELQNLDDARVCFYNKLHNFLSCNNYYSNPEWREIREFIFDEIKEWYSNLLSDSRFPVNDVTLWDQAYMSATMFKAVLAQLCMEPSKVEEYKNNPSDIKWRILGIQYDKLGFAERGFKPQQIQWYRDIAREIDNEIKNLLEYEYPVGNEIYRDETGIYFLVGEDLGEDSEDNSKLATLKNDLRDIKEKILNIFKEKTLDEFYPAIFLTKNSRGLMNLCYLLESARENFLKTDWSKKDKDKFIEKSGSDRAIGICQICRQRPVFESDIKDDENKNICNVCYKEKTVGRISKWFEDTSKETIWMDELKDKNKRVALVTMKFELHDWLNGDMLSSMVLQKDINFVEDVKKLIGNLINIYKNNQDKKVSDTVLKNYTDIALGKLKVKDNKIIESLLLERSIGDKWEKFIYEKLDDWDSVQNKPRKNKIDFDNAEIKWQSLSDENIEFLSILILQFLLRKNPSPARLRRIWESTKEFFEDIERNICSYAGIPPERGIRYYRENDKNLQEGEYYDGEAIFWVIDRKIYLISYINDKDLINKEFKLKKYPNVKESVGTFKVNDNNKENYQPYMSIIDPTPISWQFIIPAEYVPNLIDIVMKKYDENFRFVYGKLPLHIGVVVQDYKKPLYVGINALRKVRRDVKDKDLKNLEVFVKSSEIKERLKCQKTEELLNNTQSYYSLYKSKTEADKGFKFYFLESKKKQETIKSIDKFDEKEEVSIIPNTFDFEFLDTNTRRNDIFYDEKGKRILEIKSNRPYDLEIYWGKFKKFKELFKDKSNSSKLNNLISLLYEKIQDCNENYASFIAASFLNILEINKNDVMKKRISEIFELNEANFHNELIKKFEDKKNLYLFLDMFDFWHKMLKEVKGE